MKVVIDKPPNYDEIVKVFGRKVTDNAVFTYGDTIYNPHAGGISGHLIAHERVHTEQQAVIGADKWWERYLVDQKFRLEQEVEAYRAQYRSLYGLSRTQRREVLRHIVNDLAGKLYGNLVSKEEAKELITSE